jgi:hypothetical protein
VATRSIKSAAITIPTLPPMQHDVELSKTPPDVNSPRGEYFENDDDVNNCDDNNDDGDSKDPDYKGIDD